MQRIDYWPASGGGSYTIITCRRHLSEWRKNMDNSISQWVKQAHLRGPKSYSLGECVEDGFASSSRLEEEEEEEGVDSRLLSA